MAVGSELNRTSKLNCNTVCVRVYWLYGGGGGGRESGGLVEAARSEPLQRPLFPPNREGLWLVAAAPFKAR